MTTTTNIFETAIRNKIRFESARGLITSEDLFDLPLTSKAGFDLNAVAILASRNLKEAGEESFVDVAPNPARATLELKLEIIKSVIATKQAEAAARLQAADNAQKRAKLLELLARQQDSKLDSMTEEEIRAELAKIPS